MGFFNRGPEGQTSSGSAEKEDGKRKPRFGDWGKDAFIESATEARTFVCPQGVMTYRMSENPGTGKMLSYVFGSDVIEAKMKEIIAANPRAIMSEHIQKALGITVVEFQENN